MRSDWSFILFTLPDLGWLALTSSLLPFCLVLTLIKHLSAGKKGLALAPFLKRLMEHTVRVRVREPLAASHTALLYLWSHSKHGMIQPISAGIKKMIGLLPTDLSVVGVYQQ